MKDFWGNLTDRELVCAALEGKKDAFEVLFDRYAKRLVTYVQGQIADINVAEDLVQEAFLRAYESLPECEQPEKFWQWLVGIARNRILVWISKSKQMRFVDEIKPELLPKLHPPLDVDQEEWTAAMEKAMAALPAKFRAIILMRFYEGMSCAEIADTLNMQVNTITKLLSRAYEQIKTVMDHYMRKDR